MSTKVKICGITSPEDATVAFSLGADYLGLIFAQSQRRIDVGRALAIRDAVPDAMLVGVFLDQPVDDVAQTVTDSNVDLVQLHGSESPEYCDDLLARTGRPIIKSFVSSELPDTDLLSAYQTTSFFLFDMDKSILENAELEGMMAQMWTRVSKTRRKGFRVFLAGALNESNVRDAIRQTNAFCVDVCRGVEREPGLKDPDALRRFIAEVRA